MITMETTFTCARNFLVLSYTERPNGDFHREIFFFDTYEEAYDVSEDLRKDGHIACVEQVK